MASKRILTNTKLLKSKMVLIGDDNFVNCLAKLLDITRQSASAKLNGLSEFTQNEITLIQIRYNLTDSEVHEIFHGGSI